MYNNTVVPVHRMPGNTVVPGTGCNTVPGVPVPQVLHPVSGHLAQDVILLYLAQDVILLYLCLYTGCNLM